MRATGQKENDGRLPGRKAVRALRRALLAACAVLAACQAGARPWEGAGLYEASYADGDVAVTATYGKEAGIPEGAELRARLKTGEAAEQALAEAGAEDSLEAAVCGISFYKGEEEIEPKAPVSVAVQVKDGGFTAGEPVEVVHLGEDGAETLGDTKADGDGRASFVTDGFSDFVFITRGPRSWMTMANSGTEVGEVDKSDLKNFVSEVEITDSDGNVIDNKGGTLYVGEDYKIKLKFKEKGAGGWQFEPKDGKLTYQIPKNFQVDPRPETPLTVTIDGKEVTIGTYSIDKNGVLTVELTDAGKQALDEAYDVELSFDMDATAQANEGDDGGNVHFGDTGEDFSFKIVDQPLVDVKKDGKYTENGDKTGGTVEYNVKTTVKHGEVKGVVVEDVLTPPDTSALKLEMEQTKDEKPKVTVKVKRKSDGEEVELGPDDYELEKVEEGLKNPQDMAFRVKLKGDYENLQEGDELSVTYNYNVEYVEGTTGMFWGNVLNTAAVTGKMLVKDPPDSQTPQEKDFKEEYSSNVEILTVPPGNGIVFKEEDYSEATHMMHYTLYTVVPAGKWEPLYIYDDMVVEYGGKKWYIPVKDSGRVKDLTVKAVDLENSWTEGWTEDTKAGDKVEGLGKYIEKAETLTGFEGDYPNNSRISPDYRSDNINQYVYMYGWHNLYIIFGCEPGKAAGEWGHWDYNKDRLIITDYYLDMSDTLGSEITLDEMNGEGPRTLPLDQVLTAGITNNVNLRYSGYYPGYKVFFNNAERMNKTGEMDKNTNTIKYTVSLNTTDSTVKKYFMDVFTDWYKVNKTSWNFSQNYPNSMQVVFHDELPEGWEYVEGTLCVTTRDIYGNEQEYGDLDWQVGKTEISVPVVLFRNNSSEVKNHELFNAFGETLAELRFTYEVRATEEWLKKNAFNEEDIPIHNHAEIQDNNGMHWEADADVQYFPARLTKQAKQVGESNLLQFTLQVNPNAQDLDKAKDYLIVIDASTGMDIQRDTIIVKDADGNVLDPLGDITVNTDLKGKKWGLLPAEGDGQFKLMVPDGKALTITYDALIPEMGDAVHVSNKAEIDGVARTNTGYEGSLKVSDINAGGSGTTSALTIKKTDKTASSKGLAGAEFEFYFVLRKEEDTLETTDTVTVGGKGYECYTGDGEPGKKWTFSTGDDGSFEITKDRGWHLEQGRYYILKETKAPEGYKELEEPILFYFGAKDEIDEENYPGAIYALPNSTLTVGDPPIEYELPETGGPGTTAAAFLGMLLILSGSVTLLVRRKRSAG